MTREIELEMLKEFLEDYKGTQIFNTRNLVGDYMETIYHRNDIRVDYCASYDYLEVFGLSDTEFVELFKKSWLGYEV